MLKDLEAAIREKEQAREEGPPSDDQSEDDGEEEEEEDGDEDEDGEQDDEGDVVPQEEGKGEATEVGGPVIGDLGPLPSKNIDPPTEEVKRDMEKLAL